MAYRDDLGIVTHENQRLETALAKARADARLTALRQILLAFAFGLSWSVLGEDARASAPVAECIAPPNGYGWLQITLERGSTYAVDDTVRGATSTRLALRPGAHDVVIQHGAGIQRERVVVRDGRTQHLVDGVKGECP